MTDPSVLDLLRDQIGDVKSTVRDGLAANREAIVDLTEQFRAMNGRLLQAQKDVVINTERCEANRLEIARVAANTHKFSNEAQVSLGKLELEIREAEERLQRRFSQAEKGRISTKDLILIGSVLSGIIILAKVLQMLYLWLEAGGRF